MLFYNRKPLYAALTLLVLICLISTAVWVYRPTTVDTVNTSSAQSGTMSDIASSTSENATVSGTESVSSVPSDETLSSEAVSSGWTSSLPDDNGEYDLTDEQLAELLVSGLSLEDKIYMMMVVSPEALVGGDNGAVTSVGAETITALDKYPVGGIIYFAQNLIDTEQTKKMLSDTQVIADEVQHLPMLLCVDEEGGRVARVASNSAFGVEKVPPMAQITTEVEANKAGDTIGKYLAELGFNVDFAPDADVLTEPLNTAIGDRSFGSDAKLVTKLALQYANGLKKNGVLATYKHFPGHGATLGDTHDGFSSVNKKVDELSKAEFLPFASAAENGIDFVMTGHISYPEWLGGDTPASLSKTAVDYLKKDLKFNGIVITDALNMGAVIKYYDAAEAAVMAIKAGNDMLLCPASAPDELAAVNKAILDACMNDEISEQQIDRSVKKIITAKLKLQQKG